uniref:Uncharacterized protein n=1 Tax=Romanomermis culicivorax TaxID=13658 RepID=A0A915HSV3_ROMCU
MIFQLKEKSRSMKSKSGKIPSEALVHANLDGRQSPPANKVNFLKIKNAGLNQQKQQIYRLVINKHDYSSTRCSCKVLHLCKFDSLQASRKTGYRDSSL